MTGAMPRVTIGFPTYDRPAYLAQALASCLGQTYDDYEVVVVDNGSGAATQEVLDRYDAPRLRVVRFDDNIGLMPAYNALVDNAAGEIVAQLGDDDICMPDRLARTAAVFDAHPDAGVAHGDAIIIDADGRETGTWTARQFGRRALLDMLFFGGNHIISPTAAVRRAAYDACGTYEPSLPIAGDIDFWLRAAASFGFRHIAGGPVVRLRRHGANYSDESQRDRELEQVEQAVRRALGSYGLRDLAADVDWDALPQPVAERRARLVLAERFADRGLPNLAAELREEAAEEPPAVTPGSRGRIVLTSFGFNDPGGGTVVPRLASRALVARGWDVTVFHAAVQPLPGAGAYAVREWEEDGVKLVGVFNRPHGLLDIGHPRRELDDPAIAKAFAELLDRVRPDVVHYHNLHNLGLSLVDETFARGIRSFFTPHNLWLICARNHLMREGGGLCDGPGADGANCAPCAGSRDAGGYAARRIEMIERVAGRVGQVQAVSGFVRDMLVDGGLPEAMVSVLPLGAPSAETIWRAVGHHRVARDRSRPLVVGFVGAGVWHKGVFQFAAAANAVTGDVRFVLHGSISDADRARLARIDPAGRVELAGAYAHADLPGVLASIDVAVVPSAVWEGAPLTVGEARAARLPVVASRMGGLAEGVRDGIDGLLVEGWSETGLAAAMQRLVDRPFLLAVMAAAIGAPRTFADYVDDLEAGYTAGAAAHTEPTTPLAVRWRGDFDAISSLARINSEVVRRLGDGFTVDIAADDRPARTTAPPRPAAVEVRHQWPPRFDDPGLGRLVLIQPWEFGSIPRDWVEPLQDVDEVWVPSDFVRDMYVGDGVPPDRVHVVPNGVDLDVYRPAGPVRRLAPDDVCVFLFVGGTIYRKGIDVLLAAFEEAFAGRDDVLLVIKDVGAGTFYSGMNVGDELRRREAAGANVRMLSDDLDDEGLAALYRGADVLVHPYRGEGFAMPVLEAMACGRPVLVTGGGPTDEFCPPEASWRIPAHREPVAPVLLGELQAVSEPWMLEPDRTALVGLLQEVAADRAAREARGAAGRAAAEAYGLDVIAERYAARLRSVAARPVRRSQPHRPPFALPDRRGVNVLATPAWLGTDRLTDLLAAWRDAFSENDDVALYLLADPSRDGDADARERRVLDAIDAAGGGDGMADIALLEHVAFGADLQRIHDACDAYVPLHDACDGHVRLARAAGSEIVAPAAGAVGALRCRALRPAA